jgi:transposase
MTPAARIAELEAENAALRERVELLAAQVQELQARLAKDSHNSGKPPSSEGLARKPSRTKSLRQRSGKRPGGQVGHRGETLRLVATPDVVVEHRPAVCGGCQAPLPADASVVLRERRQVRDLPPVRWVVTEQQALRVRCPACHAVPPGGVPAQAPSRAPYGPRLRALAV